MNGIEQVTHGEPEMVHTVSEGVLWHTSPRVPEERKREFDLMQAVFRCQQLRDSTLHLFLLLRDRMSSQNLTLYVCRSGVVAAIRERAWENWVDEETSVSDLVPLVFRARLDSTALDALGDEAEQELSILANAILQGDAYELNDEAHNDEAVAKAFLGLKEQEVRVQRWAP